MNGRLLLPLALALAACATSDPGYREARQLLAAGRTEEGLERLERAVAAHPENAEYRAALANQRERAVGRLLAEAASARLDGRFVDAEELYQRAGRLAPRDRRIADGLKGVEVDRRHRDLLAEARDAFARDDLEAARQPLRRVLAENPRQREARQLLRRIEERQAGQDAVASPQIKSRLARPITLEFRDADVKAMFEVLSRSSGINFIFDRDIRPDMKASIFVRNTSIEEALHLLLISNQLDRRVVNQNTLLIYPNTPAKQRDYQELVVRSFYLVSADAKQTGNLMRTVLKVRDLFIDERINLLVVRDTPEVIRLAEKLVAAQDLPEPEAILEVEVLEISASRLQNLGLVWPEQIGYGLLQGAQEEGANAPAWTLAPGVVNLHDRRGLTTFTANPLLLLNMRAQDTLANVLANPRIRVKNREKAKVHIGDRVPVITSTATATGFVSQSISYLDVGVKLDVEPNVGADEEVTMKVGLEVSNIVSQVTTSSGTVAFRVGTRSAGTTLRLRDGETQVLAGLIQDEDRRTASKIPGLGDLPVLGRLFANHEDNDNKTEIVLLITPRIVRGLSFPEASAVEFTSGTDSGVGRLAGGQASGGGEGGEFPVGGGMDVLPPPSTPPPNTAPPPAGTTAPPPLPMVPQPEAGGASIVPSAPPAPGGR